MLIDLRSRPRGAGRPVQAESGRSKLALTLSPYPKGTPDPWRNGVAVDLFWYAAGGVCLAIATAQVQGEGAGRGHRTQEIATFNQVRDGAPIYFDGGRRRIKPGAVHVSWTERIAIEDDRVRRVAEVAIECCRVRLRDRMVDFMGGNDAGEVGL